VFLSGRTTFALSASGEILIGDWDEVSTKILEPGDDFPRKSTKPLDSINIHVFCFCGHDLFVKKMFNIYLLDLIGATSF